MLEKLNMLLRRLKDETVNFNDHLTEVGFLEKCFQIVESGWQAEFDDIESLKPFMITTDPIENLFIRSYLLKLLASAHITGRLQHFDPEWFNAAEENLHHELKQLTANSWSDTVCHLEPWAIMLSIMTYQVLMTNQKTYSPLVTILMATLPAGYATLASLNVIPSFSAVMRDQLLLRTPDERQRAQTLNAWFNAMLNPHFHHLEHQFWNSEAEREALAQIAPISLLDKIAGIHGVLTTQTQHFNAHFEDVGFAEHCFDLTENGWDERFNETDALTPFKSTDDAIENLLKRLFLLKLIYAANINNERCITIQNKLLEELGNYLERSCRALRYQGHDVRTQADCDELHRVGTHQLNRYLPALPVGISSLMLDLLWRSALPEVAKALISSPLIVGPLFIANQLYRQSSAGLVTLQFADRARQRFERHGVALLNTPSFRNNFLNSNAHVEMVRHNDAADEEIRLIGKNSALSLLSGILLMLSGGMLNGSRSSAFWVGIFLMAASILYYNQDNMNNARRHYGPGPK